MRLEDVFAQVFARPAESFDDATSQDTDGDWTSMKNVALLVAIEDAYKVRFSNAELTALRSLADIRAALDRKGALVT
jgi:acyl carrier protein